MIDYKNTDNTRKHPLTFYPFCNNIDGSLTDKYILSIFFASIQDSYIYEPWASRFAGYTDIDIEWYSDFLHCSINTVRKSLRHLIDNQYISVCHVDNYRLFCLTNKFKTMIHGWLYYHEKTTGCDINPKIYTIKSSLNADIDD